MLVLFVYEKFISGRIIMSSKSPTRTTIESRDKIQPMRIEDYEPGRSSIVRKEEAEV